jgi:hypothetical protein
LLITFRYCFLIFNNIFGHVLLFLLSFFVLFNWNNNINIIIVKFCFRTRRILKFGSPFLYDYSNSSIIIITKINLNWIKSSWFLFLINYYSIFLKLASQSLWQSLSFYFFIFIQSLKYFQVDRFFTFIIFFFVLNFERYTSNNKYQCYFNNNITNNSWLKTFLLYYKYKYMK